MWEFLLGIRHKGCPISDTSASLPKLSIQNISRANVPGSFGRRLLYVNGDSKEVNEFEGTCRSHDKIVSANFISNKGAEEKYCAIEIDYESENPSVLSMFDSHGVFHQGSILVQRGVEYWLAYSNDKTTIQGVIEKIEYYGNNVTTHRVVDLNELGHINSIAHGHVLSQLTSQQQVTFRAALEMGYYESKSDTVINDIAEELDRHETTTWEHLKKAENTILSNIGNQFFPSRSPSTLSQSN